MHFEATLNLVWVLVGLLAFGALGISELGRRQATLGARIRRAVAVMIAIVALFPCISASDDLVYLEQLRVRMSEGLARGRIESPRHPTHPPRLRLSLALRLESLENFRISTSPFVAVTRAHLARVEPHVLRGCDRPVPSLSNRAPPPAILHT